MEKQTSVEFSEHQIIQNKQLKKIIIRNLILIHACFFFPIHLILIIIWNYFALFDKAIFGLGRFALVFKITVTLPFINLTLPVLPYLFLVLSHIIQLSLYFWYLKPVFHFLNSGLNPVKTRKCLFGGFAQIYWIPVFFSLYSFGSNFYDIVGNNNANGLHILTDNTFICLYWFIITYVFLLFARLQMYPIFSMIRVYEVSDHSNHFENMSPFFPMLISFVLYPVFYSRIIKFLATYLSYPNSSLIMSQQLPWIFIIIGVLIFLVLALAILLIWREHKVLLPLRKQFSCLTEGSADLTHQFNITTQDDISIITSYVNEFLRKFQQQIKNLKIASSEICYGIENLTRFFETIQESAQAQNIELAPIQNSVDEISSGMVKLVETMKTSNKNTSSNLSFIDTISEGIEKIILLCQNIRRQSSLNLSRVNRVMDQIIDSMNKSVQMKHSMDLISEKITAAGNEVEHIDEILVIIQDIAEQTNILSINAAIAAAHAGDSGKGFAIVANEVRILATKSSQAVDTISEKLVDIQTIIRDSVETTLFASKVTEENNTLVKEAHGLIVRMSDQFGTLGMITENASQITAQQGTITQNFHNQIRILISFFEEFSSSMISQENVFTNLSSTAQTLRTTLSSVEKISNQVQNSLTHVKNTEESLTKMISAFRSENSPSDDDTGLVLSSEITEPDQNQVDKTVNTESLPILEEIAAPTDKITHNEE